MESPTRGTLLALLAPSSGIPAASLHIPEASNNSWCSHPKTTMGHTPASLVSGRVPCRNHTRLWCGPGGHAGRVGAMCPSGSPRAQPAQNPSDLSLATSSSPPRPGSRTGEPCQKGKPQTPDFATETAR